MAPSADSPTVITSNGSTFPLNSPRKQTNSTGPGYRGYHHVTWYVGNAKQAASYFVTRMGFKVIARKGLETGSRCVASHVVTNGTVCFDLVSPIRSSENLREAVSPADIKLLNEIHAHLTKHGDAVKDVAFEVDDVEAVYRKAVSKGAKSIQEPTTLRDENGAVVMATIQTFGNTNHTLIDRLRYRGIFLPGYQRVTAEDPLAKFLPPIDLEAMDHCVGNQDWNQLEEICE
ncbi:MAG: hypothetical protein MMC33_000034 [Icmadophila ericetorum]|nr:hypothetical protein [Icmadophila ericetorum]